MKFPEHIERAARARVAIANKQIENSLTQARKGVPLAAEPDRERLINRLQAKAGLSHEEAEMIARGAADAGRKAAVAGAEKIYGKTVDFVGVSFLERGFVSARSVARVAYRNGQARGTGFMVSDRLFLTNNHVIATPSQAAQFVIEFDYELDPQDRILGVTRFSLAPNVFFQTEDQDDLDFTLVAVGARVDGSKELPAFGRCQLSDAPDKHALGECANIVQHPDGRYKEVVLRENRLVARLDTVLHYVADTEPGSSGSPVFNKEWLVVALHHWGGPWRQRKDAQGNPLALEVNEGIRASAIVKDLRRRQGALGPAQQLLLEQVFKAGESRRPPRAVIADSSAPNGNEGNGGPQLAPDGSATWRFPVEVSVRLPWGTPAGPGPGAAAAAVPLDTAPPGASEAKVKPSSDYSSRSGYKPKFIDGHVVELPALTPAQRAIAARNQEAESGDDPFELKYHHFSIVMNKKRRLAFFTACNIDGKRAKHVDRDTGDVTPLDVEDPAIERLDPELAEGAEASESWYEDNRLDPTDYAGSDVYSKQVVAGFLDTKSMARTLRMFQRGHLVRRMDPAWGTDKQAVLADADTFHWTNCSPQVGFFNMGRKGPFDLQGTERGKLWRAIENFVLRNARAENQKVCVFSGPVFKSNDRKFRTIQVPGRFWKVVVWSEGGDLRSLAMIADQRPIITVWPEKLGEGSEAFGDADEIEKVDDFLTTVAAIETLTSLKFGDAVRSADIRAGERAERRIERLDDIPLAPRARRRRAKQARKQTRRRS
jgi:endonuclease G, mitochondrial